MEDFEINYQIAEYMNPYVKLQKIDVRTLKAMLTKEYNNGVSNKGDSDNSKDRSDHMIEHMSSAYVMLQQIKLFKCKVCIADFQNADDLQLHSVKHVTRAKSTSFTSNASNKGRKPKSKFCNKHEFASEQNATKEKSGNVQNNSEGTKKDFKKSEAKSGSRKSGLKPYCKFCRKDFVDQSALARLVRAHLSDKRYARQQCPMRFSDARKIAHKQKHAGIKTQKCEYCDKLFYTKLELKSHVTSHTGQKEFKCAECGKRFNRKVCFRSVNVGKHKQLFRCKLCAYTKKIVEIRELNNYYYQYECHACGKKLLSKILMVQHFDSRH